MSLTSFLGHPSFRDVIEPKPFTNTDGPLSDVLSETGTGGFGNGLLWICDPEELMPVFSTWVPSPRNPMVPFARTAFGDIVYAVLVDGEPPSPGILDVHYRTMRAAYATSPADFLTRVLLMDDYRAEELREPTFANARRVGDLAADEMYAFSPALVLGGSEDGPFDKVKWDVHLDFLFQATA